MNPPNPSESAEFLALQNALAGRYSLVRELGRGGMGIVFLARDVDLDRSVAIKLLPPVMAGDADLRERFLREARTAAQLSHPNIVPIYLVDQRGDLVYFVMMFVEGESLGERMRRDGSLPAGDAVRLIREVAWALAYAHGRGVVHRDIKPDNILIESATRRAMLTDFGIARRAAGGDSLTTPGLILGTLQYMAPEQADTAAPVDGRSDIYALGVTAYAAVSGRLPFESEKPQALIAAHLLEPAPPVAGVAPSIDPKLAEAIDRCLRKDPAARWQTGEALAEALGDVADTARPMPPSIRAFVAAVGSAFTQVGLLGVVLVWASLLLPAEIKTIEQVMVAVALIPLISLIPAARNVAIAGFSAREVAQAVAADARGADRYTEYVRAEMRRTVDLLRRPAGRIIAGVAGALILAAGIGILVGRSTAPSVNKSIARVFLALPSLWIGLELVGHAIQVGMFRERLTDFLGNERTRGERLRAMWWSSLPVRGLLAIGRALVRTPPRVHAAGQHRPTEVMLASAAGELFAALPATDRAALSVVPDVVRRLESAASALRARKRVVDESLASVGDAGSDVKRDLLIRDLREQQRRLEDRLRTVVESLENLRLDLLRLRAGLGTTADLTETIESARRFGQEIDYVLSARADAASAITS